MKGKRDHGTYGVNESHGGVYARTPTFTSHEVLLRIACHHSLSSFPLPSLVSLPDTTMLTCRDCSKTFRMGEREQAMYHSKGWGEPSRCIDCRRLCREGVPSHERKRKQDDANLVDVTQQPYTAESLYQQQPAQQPKSSDSGGAPSPKLPDGWIHVHAGWAGQAYYYNTYTQASQWDPPTAAAPTSMPAAPGVQTVMRPVMGRLQPVPVSGPGTGTVMKPVMGRLQPVSTGAAPVPASGVHPGWAAIGQEPPQSAVHPGWAAIGQEPPQRRAPGMGCDRAGASSERSASGMGCDRAGASSKRRASGMGCDRAGASSKRSASGMGDAWSGTGPGARCEHTVFDRFPGLSGAPAVRQLVTWQQPAAARLRSGLRGVARPRWRGR